ncbi:MAG: AAA family ATPase [Eggerthellaceae bacterium]|nr:AAA family ATPase [Eggerthellaceae bacterium]
MAMNGAYPFAAIVGQDDMKLALCLNVVQPGIGGVLISGERGTAKTTAVRALPAVLGHDIRVVELPLNATEDRVVGTLHVGALLKTGEREFVPGVLAEADGNILYVDEVNLLEDHIVDLLLDAAATGECRIEREGVSQAYPARFVLVGTMNPEEGTLRPQLLDRFGLSVTVGGTLTREQRLELVHRQVAFEADADAFRARFEDEEHKLAQRIATAAELYPHVAYPDAMAQLAAGLCSRIGVDGYRADITMMRTARAAAALDGREHVEPDDVLLAARFALPHRIKRLPFEETQLTVAMLQKAFDAEMTMLAVAVEAERDSDSQGAEPLAASPSDALQVGEAGVESPNAQDDGLGMSTDASDATSDVDAKGQDETLPMASVAFDGEGMTDPKAPGQRVQ